MSAAAPVGTRNLKQHAHCSTIGRDLDSELGPFCWSDVGPDNDFGSSGTRRLRVGALSMHRTVTCDSEPEGVPAS